MSDGNRKVQYLVTFLVSLAAVTTSVSFSWTTPVIPKFHNNETTLNVTDSEISWIVAMTSPGVFTGSMAARFTSDKFGRRMTILNSALPFAIGTIFAMTAYKSWMLYVARYFWGCGAGMVTVVSSIYLAEIAHKDIRGRLTVINRFMFNFGALLVLAVGSFVTFTELNYLLIVLPALYFFACWWVPETPYYHLKEGNIDKAKKELLKLNYYKSDKELQEKLNQMNSDVKKEMSRSGSLKELFVGKQHRRALIISLGLRITQVMAGTIPIMQYLGRIMQESKSGMEVSTALIIFGVVRFIVGLVSSAVVDRVGRRPLLIFSFFGAGVCLAIVGIYFYIQEVVGIENESSSSFRHVAFIGIILFSIVSTFGFDTLIFVVPAEIFPLNVKSVAMTTLNILGAILAFVGVIGYQTVKDLSGLYGVFWSFGTMSFIGAIFSYFVVPETKGKNLRDIQIELQGEIYDDEKLNQTISDVERNENVDVKMINMEDINEKSEDTALNR
ncbi:facilitated trehalose transporter Tret1 [Manduca sexta]|uniref:Major facilitator superfamily (MFS) profile domain-containing protein n=1 Tax=Manduca sexta TaxID=7130 RepID=A0A922CHA8_MANSE|nr:facilitated trehalose transporter Tret1 [Manduca sexta]KAG6445909.1 hypothetical protein O3G_MSEX004135 [Manduca sexta]